MILFALKIMPIRHFVLLQLATDLGRRHAPSSGPRS